MHAFFRPVALSVSLIGTVLLAAVAQSSYGAEPAPTVAAEDAKFFETQVQPILKSRCAACHSHAAKKDGGSLMVDSRGALLAGGDSGPALVPGKPDESLLITAVRYDADYPKMPPKGKLPDGEIATLVEWVRRGAPWPGADAATSARPKGKISDEDRAYWAFQPVRETAPPQVADSAWNRNPVDRFLRAKLDAAGLAPSPPAEPAVLLRRLYFDLTGLPPAPEEVDEFVRACARQGADEAYAAAVDRLLDSPRYGEHWARHWLDLVRYAESDGYRLDSYRPEAWRYRDYVIKAFNDDKPYDRFVREQIAGDELAPNDPEAMIATTFLRLGIYEYNNRDVRTQWQIMLDDVTDVVSDVFIGLGMGCAKCHDHKFDPILQKDYFRLQAFLAGMQPHDDLPLATDAELQEHRRRMAAWERKNAAVLAELEALEGPERVKAERGAVDKFPPDVQEILHKPAADRTPLERQLGALAYRQVTYEFERLDTRFKDEQKERLVAVRKKLSEVSADRPAPLPLPMTVRDVGSEAPPIFVPKKRGEPIEPGFMEVLGLAPPTIVPPAGLNSTGRRTALANWLTEPTNPLSTRVIVNRVWQYHFGRGLVRTSSDFGRLGEPPTHPELLDWLTANFVRDGWSLKKLHRLLVTSAAYRQQSGGRLETGDRRLATGDGSLKTAVAKSGDQSPSVSGFQSPVSTLQSPLIVDPENKLLWRMPNRRLDAEQIRDELLAATGRLDLKAGGPAVDVTQPRRSIYCRVTRNSRDPLLEVFDVPEGFQSASERNVTTTPTQALLMINSQTMLDHARSFAKHLRTLHPGAAGASDVAAARVEAAFRLTFGRRPTEAERRTAAAFFANQSRRIRPDQSAPPPVVKLEKIPYRDGHAVVLDPSGMMRRAEAPDDRRLPSGDFTIEAFVVLRSTYENASVRTIAAHWNGDKTGPGWSFGVTSLRSAFKPQMLVLQLWGEDENGKPHYEPIFSSLNIQLNKPYYVAASVRLADAGPEGVTFFAKDLSNDDEPLLQSSNRHTVVRIPQKRGQFTIGGRGGPQFGNLWDGLVDDVRLSNERLDIDKLLLTLEQVGPSTVGFWEFEPAGGLFRDSSPNKLDLSAGEDVAKSASADADEQALVDFCHVLLNANEFLYVD